MGTTDSSKAGFNVEAGLPNITGMMTIDAGAGVLNSSNGQYSGCFYPIATTQYDYSLTGSKYTNGRPLGFDASKSNSIYGKSTTVQPAAYYVYIWRRIS